MICNIMQYQQIIETVTAYQMNQTIQTLQRSQAIRQYEGTAPDIWILHVGSLNMM